MFDFSFFGTDTYGFIHHLLDHGDIDYVKLFGQGHRQFMHDQRAVDYITANYGIVAGQVALAHISLDRVWSHSKRYGTKKQE